MQAMSSELENVRKALSAAQQREMDQIAQSASAQKAIQTLQQRCQTLEKEQSEGQAREMALQAAKTKLEQEHENATKQQAETNDKFTPSFSFKSFFCT